VRDRCLVLINRTAETIFGIERGNFIGMGMHGHCEETEQNLFPLADEALTTLDLQTIGEHTVRTPHNGARILNTRNLSIPDETGERRYLLSLSEDITERKEAEAPH
jgi:PAS domain S-box-containing protein